MKHIRIALSVGILALSASPGRASAQLANFDDLPLTFGGIVPAPYPALGGYYFNYNAGGIVPTAALEYASQSAGIQCRSLQNCALNNHGSATILIRSGTSLATDKFTFSAWLSGIGGTGVNGSAGASGVRVSGYSGGGVVADFTTDFALGAAPWVQIDLTSRLFNLVTLTPLNSTGNPFVYTSSADQPGFLKIDDITFRQTIVVPPTNPPSSTVPEPGSMALLAAGLGVIAVAARRKQRGAV